MKTVSTNLKFISPDGREVVARSAKQVFTNRCDATIRVEPARLDGKIPDSAQGRELHICIAGNYDVIAKEALDATLEQRLTVPGGELLVYRSSHPDLQGLAIWRGPHHELASWLPPVPESAGIDPWERFAGLTITDSPEGMLVTPTLNSSLAVNVVDVTNYVEGVGMLYFYPPDEGLKRVPTWKGAQTPVGEMWKTTIRDDSSVVVQTYFVLANRSAVVAVMPEAGATSSYKPQLGFIESLVQLECNRRVRRAS